MNEGILAVTTTNPDLYRAKANRISRTSAKQLFEIGSSYVISSEIIAALAIVGVAVVTLNASVFLFACMAIVGIGTAVSGGDTAIAQEQRQKDQFLTLASATYQDAEQWVYAIESQIRECSYPRASAMGCDNYVENGMDSGQAGTGLSQWKLRTVLSGIPILQSDTEGSTEPHSEMPSTFHPRSRTGASAPASVACLRVCVPMRASVEYVQQTLLCMPPAILTGTFRHLHTLENMDANTDIVYAELDAVYVYPTYTGEH